MRLYAYAPMPCPLDWIRPALLSTKSLASVLVAEYMPPRDSDEWGAPEGADDEAGE